MLINLASFCVPEEAIWTLFWPFSFLTPWLPPRLYLQSCPHSLSPLSRLLVRSCKIPERFYFRLVVLLSKEGWRGPKTWGPPGKGRGKGEPRVVVLHCFFQTAGARACYDWYTDVIVILVVTCYIYRESNLLFPAAAKYLHNFWHSWQRQPGKENRIVRVPNTCDRILVENNTYHSTLYRNVSRPSST